MNDHIDPVGSSDTKASALVDSAALSADHAIRSSQRAVNDTLDHLAERVEDTRVRTGPALDRLGAEAGALKSRGIDAVRHGSQQLRERALHATDATAGRIRHDPFQSMLIAAAAGAALAALVTLLSRAGNTRP